ncbi:EAL domain-containing protein [Hirschia litorea]|uniref:EAL domain-containing protein n=1 Tax=Hirschia litorea TaxID=1199156 RepID=A0ABW2IIX1_9PROT
MPSTKTTTDKSSSIAKSATDLFIESDINGTIIFAEGDGSLLNTVDVRMLVLSNLFQLLNVPDISKIQEAFVSLAPGLRASFDDMSHSPHGRRITIKRNDASPATFQVSVADLSQHKVLQDLKVDEHLIRAFRSSLVSPELKAARQPVVCTQTGQLRHYEILARFPFEGSPYPMIVAAERRGIISELDCVMLDAVCQRLSHPSGHGLKLAVNISGQSIQRTDIACELNRIVRAYDFNKDRLILEITESSQMHDIDTASNVVDLLKNTGAKVVLDDFGAGAASFGYLRALNVDGVKFDGCFLNGQGSNERNTALMRAISGMCRELGMSVVGERVETETDRQTLLNTGVMLAQGYHFGRPEIDSIFFADRRQKRDAA